MTVYVDDFRIPARVGKVRGRWSHMTADTEEELHDFAQNKLGLKRGWFQDPRVARKGQSGPAKPGSYPAESWHYDVTDSKRRQAIAMGRTTHLLERSPHGY